jgi:hypothetical protein
MKGLKETITLEYVCDIAIDMLTAVHSLPMEYHSARLSGFNAVRNLCCVMLNKYMSNDYDNNFYVVTLKDTRDQCSKSIEAIQ